MYASVVKAEKAALESALVIETVPRLLEQSQTIFKVTVTTFAVAELLRS
jgi:hypothetical protein